MQVDGIYRVAAGAEIFRGSFSTVEGHFIQEPGFMRYPLSPYYTYYPAMYKSRLRPDISHLYGELFRNTEARAVIEYNNIGCLVVENETSYVLPYETMQQRDIRNIGESLFPTTREVGICKTIVQNFNIPYMLAKLHVWEEASDWYIWTRYGKCRVGFNLDRVSPYPGVSKLAALNEDEESYGAVFYDGKIHRVTVDKKNKILCLNEGGTLNEAK